MDELDGLEEAIERVQMSPVEREADALTSFAAEFGASIPPEQIAARYSALERYWKSEQDFTEALEVVSGVLGAALCGSGVSAETLGAVPDALQAAIDDLWEAVDKATAVAGV